MEPVIDRAGATDLPPIPETSVPPEPSSEVKQETTILQPQLHVHYVGLNAKGKQRQGRSFIVGLVTMISPNDVRHVEALIAQNTGLTDVEVLGWRLLHG